MDAGVDPVGAWASASGAGRAVAWSEELWAVMAPVHAAVLAHPFVTGLADGTLPRAAFTRYLAQDVHYLRGYARALALLAGRATEPADVAVLARHAVGAAEVEPALHADLLPALGLDPATLAAVPVSPACHAYVAHLLAAVSTGSLADGLAAVLPCYWMYARVGETLLAGGSPDPLYARWIASYGGEEFAAVVAEMLVLVDRVGPGLTPAERSGAATQALASARYEWMFWDSAYRDETWPV